jgi:hypothetical protein
MGKDATLSCPSGCPRDLFPREAVVFDTPKPHIIIVWDGYKIDKLPIPITQENITLSMRQRLASNKVLDLVRSFLSDKGVLLPGLSLRIHSRDPATEYVTFAPIYKRIGY